MVNLSCQFEGMQNMSIINFKRMPKRLASRQSDGGIVFQLRFLFPDNFSLYQVDKRLARTSWWQEWKRAGHIAP